VEFFISFVILCCGVGLILGLGQVCTAIDKLRKEIAKQNEANKVVCGLRQTVSGLPYLVVRFKDVISLGCGRYPGAAFVGAEMRLQLFFGDVSARSYSRSSLGHWCLWSESQGYRASRSRFSKGHRVGRHASWGFF